MPGRGGRKGANKRRFHVEIEGSRKLTDYDIFEAAGGALHARTETFVVDVTDGILDIDFLTGAADNPIIAAIEVLPTQLVLEPVADTYVRGEPYQHTSFGAEGALLVKSAPGPGDHHHHTYLKFPLTNVKKVGSAKLRLYGSNIESSANITLSAYRVPDDSWPEMGTSYSSAPAGLGGDLGSVYVNDTVRYYEIDVTPFVRAQLNGDKTASFLLIQPDLKNAMLSFNSRENLANRPQLVIEATTPPAARTAAEEDFVLQVPKPEVSSIYPNPAAKRFAVYVSAKHQGQVVMQLVNLSGNTFQIQSQQSAAPARLHEVNVSSMQLPKGTYIMKIQSKTLTETIKVLLNE